MALFIEVIEGNDLGQRFRLSEGIRLGRSTGEILIKDSKVSALHAQVEKDQKGQLVLVDRESANGLRINGQRVKRVALLPGVKFQIGKTLFKVQIVDSNEPEVVPEEIAGQKDWRSVLSDKVPRMIAQNRTTAFAVQPFNPALVLYFLEGVQAETEITLGYGPRKFGSDVLDIEIQEPAAPDIAFELHPDEGGIKFLTRYPKSVLLNDSQKNTEYIQEGDKIRIGQSLIEIRFLK